MKTESRVDRLIRNFFPTWQVKRDHARAWSEYYQFVESNTSKFANSTFNSRNKASSSSSYRGAVGSRVDQTWIESESSTGIRHLRKANLYQLRDRARQLDRDNMLAGPILDRAVENVVWSGFKLQARTGSEDLNSRIEGLWREYEDKDNCDVRGILSLSEITEHVFRNTYRDGDCGINLISDGRVEIIAGDLIDNPIKAPDGVRIIDGIQIARSGKPTNYWVKGYKNSKTVSMSIDASDFIFLARMRRSSALRGEPVFSNVFPLFDQIDGYIDSSVVAARMAALFGLIVRGESKGPYQTLPKKDDASGISRPIQGLEPGMIRRMDSFSDIFQVKPEQPHQMFSEFTSQLIRFTGLSLGLPLELVMLDFSRSNYSNTRGVLLQTQRTHRKIQDWLIRNFLARLYKWRLRKWIESGEINSGDREDVYSHRWIPPGWSWIDPHKEMEGVALALDMGLTTRSDEAAKQGRDFEEMVKIREFENELLRNAGIVESRSKRTRDVDDD